MGEGVLSHADIQAWQYNMHRRLDAWEVQLLRRLSAMYLSAQQDGQYSDSVKPYIDTSEEVLAQKRQQASASIKSIFKKG